MKKLVLLLCVIASFGFFSTRSYADGSVNTVTISKSVLNPQTKTYVHNLGIGEAVYHSNDSVIFHITLKNTSNVNIDQLIVKDYFPQYINFVSGVGSFDQKNKILSFLVYNLKPNTTQTFAISAKVVNSDQFPTNQRDICVSNKASLLFGHNQTTQDTAQFCIEISNQNLQQQGTQSQPQPSPQSVYPPTKAVTTPSTGPSLWSILLIVIFVLTGFYLVKTTNKLARI